MEPDLGDLENGWPVQIRKRREIRHVTHGSNCPSKQTQEWRQDYPGRICGECSWVLAWIPLTFKEGYKVLRQLYWQKHCQPGLKETELGN